MAETIRGGAYQLADKRWVNANGEPIERPSKAELAEAKNAEGEGPSGEDSAEKPKGKGK